MGGDGLYDGIHAFTVYTHIYILYSGTLYTHKHMISSVSHARGIRGKHRTRANVVYLKRIAHIGEDSSSAIRKRIFALA